MASSSKNVPLQPIRESDGSGGEFPLTKEHRPAPPKGKGKQRTRPIITAIRIPADGTLPYLISLQLVKATSDYHLKVHDSNLLHHSNINGTRPTHRHSSIFLDPLADDDQLDINQMYDPLASIVGKANWPVDLLERDPHLNAHSYGNGNGTFLDVPLTERTEKPHLTFTHASLRLQPNVVDSYWRSEEAWNRRAFKRVHVNPRKGQRLERLKGEYHIMYTRVLGSGLRPNQEAKGRVFGDVFLLKMASGKNEEGDWYYEDIPPVVTEAGITSLRNHCLETLRSLRPTNYKMLVGERGNGPPGVLSPGTGLPGMVARIVCRPIL